MMRRHRGRTASYPTAPAQIPTSGITASGFSEVFASAKALSETRSYSPTCAFRTTYDMRFDNGKLFHPLIEAKPVETFTLTTLIEMFPPRSDGLEIERIETGKVAIHTEVISINLVLLLFQ